MDIVEDVLIPMLAILGALLVWDGFLKDVILSLFNQS